MDNRIKWANGRDPMDNRIKRANGRDPMDIQKAQSQMAALKSHYMHTPIPETLDGMVRQTLQTCRLQRAVKHRGGWLLQMTAAAAAVLLALLTVGVNVSPVMAASLEKVPVLGSLAKVLTFREYTIREEGYDLHVEVPVVEGLQDQALVEGLNAKYLEEGKRLYEAFMADMANLRQNGDGHLGMESGYEVVTDTEDLLAIGRYVVNTVGSSSTTYHFDTIDKHNEVLLTLPGLFKDDAYRDIISENIRQQMMAQHQEDSGKFYWVEGIDQKVPMELFAGIDPDQNFYINADNQLVISFDKYEVAPGYMGIVQFVIPTEILTDDLVSDMYIK